MAPATGIRAALVILLADLAVNVARGQPAAAATPLAAGSPGLFTTAPPELPSSSTAAATGSDNSDDRPVWAPRQLCGPAAGSGWRCRNWAGTVEWAPEAIVVPETEEALAAFLRAEAAEAAASGAARRPLRVVGFAHSWSGIYVPAGAGVTPSATAAGSSGASGGGNTGVTIALHKLAGVTQIIPPPKGVQGAVGYAEVRAGTSFARLFEELDARGLALLVPPGGIQGLTVGGAVSVGFHGSQSTLGGASSGVAALRVLDSDGGVHELSEGTDPEAMRAARLALGTCGVITRATMPVVPQFHLKRRRWRVDGVDGFLDSGLAPLVAAHERFHYYVHPATDSAWPMTWEPTTPEASAAEGRPCVTALEQHDDARMAEFGPDGLPLIMRWDNCSDVSHRALTHAVDMEAQPLWNGELYLPLPADPAAAAAAEAAAVKELLRRFEAVAAAAAAAAADADGCAPGDGTCASEQQKSSSGSANGSANGSTTTASSRVHRDLWLHVRYVAGDEQAYLNPCYGAPVCAAIELALVAHTMAAPLPPWGAWAPYFAAMQDALLPRGARPHAAKFHAIERSMVPAKAFGLPVAEFAAQCARLDPARAMRDPELDAVFGFGEAAAAAAAEAAPAAA